MIIVGDFGISSVIRTIIRRIIKYEVKGTTIIANYSQKR
jgi:hypothetical protein